MAQNVRAGAFQEDNQRINIPLSRIKNADLTPLAAAASAGKFGIIAGGFGVGTIKLEGEAASGNTKTSDGSDDLGMPQNYVATTPLVLEAQAKVTATPATSAQLSMQAYKSDGNGGVTGANLVTSGSPATLTNAWGAKSFTINGSSLSPGDELVYFLRSVVDDTTGGTGAKANIGKIDFKLSTKM